MGKSNSSPTIPDPATLIAQQAQANRVTEFTPGGNRFFGTVGPEGRFTATPGQAASFVEESPGTAALRTLNERLGVELGNTAGLRVNQLPQDMIDFGGLPEIRSGGDTSDLERSIFESQKGLLDPVFGQSEERLRQRLANQGIGQGNRAFDTEIGNFMRNKGDVYSRLAQSSVAAGRQEDTRQFTQDVTRRRLAADEQLAERGGNLNEIAALLGRVPGINPQQFSAPGQVDVMGPQQLQFGAQQIQSQNQNAMLGGLFGLGGTLGAAYMLR